MPIYEFECSRCGNRREEIQKYTDDPPFDPDTMCPATIDVDMPDDAGGIVSTPSDYDEPSPCAYHMMPTTFTQRWRGEYGSDGRGGWVRQGDAMIRTTQGSEKTKYGEGA